MYNSMGTLSGCSFSTLDFSFKPRELTRHGVLETKRPKNLFSLCRGSLRKQRIHILSFRNFGRFRCCSSSNGNGNGDREGTSSTSNNDTTTTTETTTTTAAPPEEAEERHKNDFESDKSTPASVSSSRVLCVSLCTCVYWYILAFPSYLFEEVHTFCCLEIL